MLWGMMFENWLPYSMSVERRLRNASSTPGQRQNNAIHAEPPITRFQVANRPRRPGDRNSLIGLDRYGIN